MRKITIFTASVINNDILSKEEIQFCIDSFDNLKQAILKNGCDCEIKVFDWSSPEIIQFKSIFNYQVQPQFIADAFRMWMLANHEDHLWLDYDEYIHPEIVNSDLSWLLQDDYVMTRQCWDFIFNGKNIELFKEIYSGYISGKFIGKVDRDIVSNYLTYETHFPDLYYITHLTNLFKNRPMYENIINRIQFINSLEELDINVLQRKKNFIFTTNPKLIGKRFIYIKNKQKIIHFIISLIQQNKAIDRTINYCGKQLTCNEVIEKLYKEI